MVMQFPMRSHKDEEIAELKGQVFDLKEERDFLQEDFDELDAQFDKVQKKIPSLKKEVIHYNEHGHISDYSAVELIKIIEQMEY